MTDPNSPYAAGSTVTLLTNTFTAPTGYEWSGWEVTDANDNVISVSNNQFTMPASDVTVSAQWTQSGGGTTGTINFGSASGSTNINSESVTGNDSQGNTWMVTTVGTTSFTPNANYAQVGSSSKPATSITFTMTLPQSANITAFSAKFGGFNGTAGTITLKVDDTTVGTGSLNGTNDVTVTNSSSETGTTLTVTVTNISKGVKCYFISYTYEVSTTPTISFNPSSISLGNVPVGQQIQETFTVAQANLTAGIALSANVGTLSTSSIAQGAAATQVTWTYTPATAGAISATVTATSGTLTETLSITGTAKTAHNITIANMTNGSVTASENSAIEGQTITLTVTPDAGYTLDALTVTNNTTNTQVTVTNNTFEMPDAPVTVSATFSQIQAMTVSEAIAAIDNASNNQVNGAYVAGIICQVDSYNSNYSSITYWISDDGGTTTMLQVYSGLGLNGAQFSAVTDLSVGDEVVVYGNLQKFGDIYEFNYNSQIVSLVHAVPYTLSLGTHTNISEFFMFAGTESNDIEFDQNGEVEINAGTTVYVSVEAEDCYVMNGLNITYGNNQTATVTTLEPHVYYSFVMPESDATLTFVTTQAQQFELSVGMLSNVTLEMTAGAESDEVEDGDEICEGLNVTIIATAEQGYVLQAVNVVDGNNTPVTVNNEGNGVYWFVMPSSDVTVSATAVARTLNTYTLATSITSGSTYIITNGMDMAMGYQKTNNRSAEDALISAGVANVGSDNIASASSDQMIYEFVIESYGNDGYYTIYDAVNEGYLYAAGGNGNNPKNYLKTETDLDANDNGLWSIVIDANGVATIISQGNASRKNMRYNSSDGLFSCYGSGQQDIYLYVKNANPQTQSYTKQVAAYNGTGGYVLIASPVIGVVPTASNGFLTNNYDFYYFDQSQEAEWRNFEANSYDLISGKGYLYANSGNNGQATTLTFTGTPYTGNGQITLSKVSGADWEGWNLIGNPYANAAILKDASNVNQAFYTLNGAGSELAAGTPGATIAAMEGVFVEAAAAGEVVTFVEQQPASSTSGNSNYISINVSRNRGGLIDRALVGIGEGPMLHKFQLNPNHTKVYITEGNQDYAIVRSANQGELPVNFKAEENGSYTLSVNPENVEMNYLHLIDNMTGADVDLLATPSYTFEARTSDYASRFKLVFSANGTNENTMDDAPFAYFNGTNWTVSNTGDATLQVVDMMGRVLSSETLSGNATVSLNQPAGVYMLRLVNGNDVKVQKVVVQ